MKYSSAPLAGGSNLTSSMRSLSSGNEQNLRQENDKLKQYLQDYESQIKDLESELSQLKWSKFSLYIKFQNYEK